MKKSQNYYRVLHVTPDAPDLVIKASYRTLMQRLHMHPDLGGDHLRAALINEAFRTLGDPARRARYDATLKQVGLSEQDAPETAAPPPAPAPAAPRDADWPHCPFCGTTYTPSDAERPDCACAKCGAALFPVERHQSDGQCRRAIDRLPRNMRITFVRAAAHKVACKGITHDISLNGLRFLTHTRLAVDERLLIECDFCSAVGIVRSVRAHGVDADGWECGVEFVTMRVRHARGGLVNLVAG